MEINVVVVTVTWNRCQDINRVIKALSLQNFLINRLDVIVVDNASSDGTVDILIENWHPEYIINNSTTVAHQPQFQPSVIPSNQKITNKAGFRSLTIIRNSHNHGGCGGFNTGFTFIESIFTQIHQLANDDYIWLIDDDVDLPPDALENLLKVAESDISIGLVGSRAVDIHDRKTTLETTIYFDFQRGYMTDTPPVEHPQYAAHSHWVSKYDGATRGQQNFQGVIDVDVVSACSLLARWSGVCKVGFWDYRYFIYCDDADWSLRFAKAGYRVVCNLDAVVYHTPWFSKLTPTRLYYAQRNIVWMMQKVVLKSHLQYATFSKLVSILKDSLRASFFRRLFHAEIIRRTAHDIVLNRGGKLNFEEPKPLPIFDSLDSIAALNANAHIVVVCNHAATIDWAEELRLDINKILASTNRLREQPQWTYLVRNDIHDLPQILNKLQGKDFPECIVYAGNRYSKIWRQLKLLFKPITSVIIFDQNNDFPLFRGKYNVHIDHKKPTVAQVERNNVIEHIKFLARFSFTTLMCLIYSVKIRPYISPNKYG
jgi:GT2 family glycosyltransferase